jgi:hypothetical protein
MMQINPQSRCTGDGRFSGEGADFLAALATGPETIVLAPHKALSGFWTNDITSSCASATSRP